jgi:hypothetical protein
MGRTRGKVRREKASDFSTDGIVVNHTCRSRMWDVPPPGDQDKYVYI